MRQLLKILQANRTIKRITYFLTILIKYPALVFMLAPHLLRMPAFLPLSIHKTSTVKGTPMNKPNNLILIFTLLATVFIPTLGQASMLEEVQNSAGTSGGHRKGASLILFEKGNKVAVASSHEGAGVLRIYSATSDISTASPISTIYGDSNIVSDRFGIYAAPHADDVNGDGIEDYAILAMGGYTASATSRVEVRNGSNNNILYTLTMPYAGAGWRLAMGDITGDGHAETLVGNYNPHNELRAYDGATGALLWKRFEAGIGLNVYAHNDIDGNGVKDLIVSSQSGGGKIDVFYCPCESDSVVNGVPAFTVAPNHTILSSSVGPIDGDFGKSLAVVQKPNSTEGILVAGGYGKATVLALPSYDLINQYVGPVGFYSGTSVGAVYDRDANKFVSIVGEPGCNIPTPDDGRVIMLTSPSFNVPVELPLPIASNYTINQRGEVLVAGQISTGVNLVVSGAPLFGNLGYFKGNAIVAKLNEYSGSTLATFNGGLLGNGDATLTNGQLVDDGAYKYMTGIPGANGSVSQDAVWQNKIRYLAHRKVLIGATVIFPVSNASTSLSLQKPTGAITVEFKLTRNAGNNDFKVEVRKSGQVIVSNNNVALPTSNKVRFNATFNPADGAVQAWVNGAPITLSAPAIAPTVSLTGNKDSMSLFAKTRTARVRAITAYSADVNNEVKGVSMIAKDAKMEFAILNVLSPQTIEVKMDDLAPLPPELIPVWLNAINIQPDETNVTGSVDYLFKANNPSFDISSPHHYKVRLDQFIATCNVEANGDCK